MAKQYEATGPFTLGGEQVTSFEEGEVVPGAADLANLEELLDAGRLREAGSTKATPEAEPDQADEVAPKSAAKKRSGSRSRTTSG